MIFEKSCFYRIDLRLPDRLPLSCRKAKIISSIIHFQIQYSHEKNDILEKHFRSVVAQYINVRL